MLSDCITPNRSIAELFIMRDEAVVALTKSARDRYTQATLALTQDIVGLHKSSLEDVLDHEGFKWLIAALGIGISLSDEMPCQTYLNIEFLRYDRIILATEETPPDALFRTEIFSLLHRYMKPVISSGHLSTALVSPLAMASEAEFERTVMNPETRNVRPYGS